MTERKHPVRMPDGTVTYDLDEYYKAWRALGEPVEKLLPLYEMDAWDPDVRFTLKTLGTPHSFSMPVPAARQLADSVAKIEAERDEARAALAESEKWRVHWETLDALAAQKAIDGIKEERDALKAKLDAELPAAWREDIDSLNRLLEQSNKARDAFRQALSDMVNSCRLYCTAQSYCGICKIALEAMVEEA